MAFNVNLQFTKFTDKLKHYLSSNLKHRVNVSYHDMLPLKSNYLHYVFSLQDTQYLCFK